MTQPRAGIAFVQAGLVGAAYVLAFQLAFLLMPFTTETLWLWLLGAMEAIDSGRTAAFLGDGEWWLALAFPVCVFTLGFLGAYSYRVDRNPIPAIVAGGFLGAFYLTEITFMGRFEFAILYIAITPILVLIAVVGHFRAPHWIATEA